MVEEPGIEHFLFVEDIEALVYITLVISAAIFLYGLYRRMVSWFGSFPPPLPSPGRALRNIVVYGLLQRRVVRKPSTGGMHVLVFYGFIILFIGTVLRALEYDVTLRFFGTRFLVGDTYLVFKFFMNIGGLIAIIGLIGLLLRRGGFKSPYLPDRPSDYLLLITLLVILFTGFLLDSIATLSYRMGWIGLYDFIGVALASSLEGLGLDLVGLYRGLWVFHMVLAQLSVALIPYTKLGHIVFGGIFNYAYARERHPAEIPGPEDPEAEAEEKGYIGVLTISDLNWKERMDLDACIECSRCTDVCPATASGKPLSPMHLILSLRDLAREGYDGELVPDKIEPDILWSCVTCGACVDACPMLIHHVETIIDIRRGLVSKGEEVPEDALNVSYNLMRYGNPMGYDPMERMKVIEELSRETGVPIAEEGGEYEYLFWVGCQTVYEPANREIAKSLLSLLRKAGVDVAIMPDETCCGEPAKRIGDELMYVEIVRMNIEGFSKYRFKKLLVNCPHGYTVFKHEYRRYGLSLDVVHHTQLLSQLLREGRLRPKRRDRPITFHDPCYLGRWNGVLEEPREVIRSVTSDFREMPRSGRRSFCCGAGGGQMFYEVKRGERISRLRMMEARETGAEVIGTACPFCRTMFLAEANDSVEVLDISQLLEAAVDEDGEA